MKLMFDQEGSRACNVASGVIAGWTARDRAAVDHHIAELAKLNVPAPSAVPLFYRISSSLFTTAPAIQTVGSASSGEAEPVLFNENGRLWLGVGSDHTDRKLESHSVALSKQICAKPISATLWAFDGVSDRVEGFELRSWIRDCEEDAWTPYQEGTLQTLRPLLELAAAAPLADRAGGLVQGTMMMCGTLGVLSGQVRHSRFFRVELKDPKLDRAIGHAYETVILPEVA